MSSVDLSIDFGARLSASLGDFGRFRAQALDVLDEADTLWTQDLLEVWPVDTGTSLQGWDNFIDGLVWVIRNAVEYTSFVHAEGDDVPIVGFLEAQAETYAASAMVDLRGLLDQARAEDRPRRQAALFGRVGPSLPTADAIAGAALFRASVQAFERRGARQRLRDRFPSQPIGRALTRRRDRAR